MKSINATKSIYNKINIKVSLRDKKLRNYTPRGKSKRLQRQKDDTFALLDNIKYLIKRVFYH